MKVDDETMNDSWKKKKKKVEVELKKRWERKHVFQFSIHLQFLGLRDEYRRAEYHVVENEEI